MSRDPSAGTRPPFGRIPLQRREGSERFHHSGVDLGFDLLGFWQWSVSDVVSNATRGRLAEYLVAQALGAATGVRDEWAAYDLVDPRGIAIEVKSAAYLQSWHQEQWSSISFRCPPSRAWDAQTGVTSDVRKRQSEVYVFALLAHRDQATLDPFDLSQWEFHVLPTAVLDRRQPERDSITLSALQALHGPPVAYAALREAVAKAAEAHRAVPPHA